MNPDLNKKAEPFKKDIIGESTKCPFMNGTVKNTAGHGTTNDDWWPNRLKLNVLRLHDPAHNPMPEGFNYKEAFNSLNLEEVKKDLLDLMTDSQDWWPADYGNYGGLMIRLAWHSAGTYRIADGRGGSSTGSQRFAPLNSWPDNGNLDKARLLLWPIKKKYGNAISWADLYVLAGNMAYEKMGFKTYGYAGGREDIWEPEQDAYWGSETEWGANDIRYANGELEQPLGAVMMGWIYVNPEGPNGVPDPIASAHNVRTSFGRMAMNDYETVALVAGGHTVGKCHGAASADQYVEAEPEASPIHMMSKGWKNNYKTGIGDHSTTSGLEGAWTPNPVQWDHDYFRVLLDYDWEVTKSPAGAFQWRPKDSSNPDQAPMAHDPSKKQDLLMTTGDIALKADPEYLKICKHFRANPDEFETAFAKAWYKLTHRDMGPKSRYLGPDVPEGNELWQDPLPEPTFTAVSDEKISDLKQQILSSGIAPEALVRVAWGSAATYRNSDKRGGANGSRIRFEPQRNWEVNNPEELNDVLNALEKIRLDFNNAQEGSAGLSMADMIVLAGNAAVELAASKAGHDVQIPFNQGRVDALEEETDNEAFQHLKFKADGFRNYRPDDQKASGEDLLVDQAQLLTLSIPEMTALIGGMRAMNANWDGSDHGIFTDRPGQLTTDYFDVVTDLDLQWEPLSSSELLFSGSDRKTGEQKYTGTRVDLIFGSNTELRAVSEVYACKGNEELFVKDFVAAWHKVMNLDRFDR